MFNSFLLTFLLACLWIHGIATDEHFILKSIVYRISLDVFQLNVFHKKFQYEFWYFCFIVLYRTSFNQDKKN